MSASRYSKIHIKKRKRDPEKFNIDILSKSTEGFSGAEIEEAVISALYSAFPQERDLVTDDILRAADETVPLSETQFEQISKLREWAKNRTRMAS
jgi:SpoVK/Ycf46/Vps4 family AAA+-type ATPase